MNHSTDSLDYPFNVIDYHQMNRILRHRIRNHCFGMKMGVERIQQAKEVEETCMLMLDELENFLKFSTRLDLVFSPLPDPIPMDFQTILQKVYQLFAENHPYVSLVAQGPPITLSIAAGNLIQLVLVELLNNAAEAALDPQPVLTWEWQEPDRLLTLKVINLSDDPIQVPVNPPVPFFTTRGRHEGIGLTFVQRVANSLQGQFHLTQTDTNQVIAQFSFTVDSPTFNKAKINYS